MAQHWGEDMLSYIIVHKISWNEVGMTHGTTLQILYP